VTKTFSSYEIVKFIPRDEMKKNLRRQFNMMMKMFFSHPQKEFSSRIFHSSRPEFHHTRPGERKINSANDESRFDATNFIHLLFFK
jgi:hypothetical protein